MVEIFASVWRPLVRRMGLGPRIAAKMLLQEGALHPPPGFRRLAGFAWDGERARRAYRIELGPVR